MSEDILTADKLDSLIATFRREVRLEPCAGRIIESAHMADGPFEDWSHVRSPGRARRRRRKGYRQNIRVYYTPRKDFVKLPDGTLIGHPATVRALMQKVGDGMRDKADRIVESYFYGRHPETTQKRAKPA